MEQYTIYIASPHALFREGLKKLINTIPYLFVTGECSNFEQISSTFRQRSSHTLLIHLIPFKEGLDTIGQVMNQFPEVSIIAILNELEHRQAQQLTNLGLNGILHTSIAETELKHAFHIMAQGEQYFSSSITPLIHSKKYTTGADFFDPQQIEWKPRDLVLIKQLCKGYDNYQICEELGLQCRTVEGLKSQLMNKANVPNTVNLVLFALKNKLVDINEI